MTTNTRQFYVHILNRELKKINRVQKIFQKLSYIEEFKMFFASSNILELFDIIKKEIEFIKEMVKDEVY